MACVNDDGSLSQSGIAILNAVSTSSSLEDIQRRSSLPMYRVRSGLRDLVDAGLVELSPTKENEYILTIGGKEALVRNQ